MNNRLEKLQPWAVSLGQIAVGRIDEERLEQADEKLQSAVIASLLLMTTRRWAMVVLALLGCSLYFTTPPMIFVYVTGLLAIAPYLCALLITPVEAADNIKDIKNNRMADWNEIFYQQ